MDVGHGEPVVGRRRDPAAAVDTDRGGERLERLPRALEGRRERRLVRLSLARLREPPARPVERVSIHGDDCSFRVG